MVNGLVSDPSSRTYVAVLVRFGHRVMAICKVENHSFMGGPA